MNKLAKYWLPCTAHLTPVQRNNIIQTQYIQTLPLTDTLMFTYTTNTVGKVNLKKQQ